MGKVKKIGLASVGLLMMMTILTTESSANKKLKEPELRVNNTGESVTIDWAVEMADEDVLYQTGFEVGDELPSLEFKQPDKSGGLTGGQSFTEEDSVEGVRSLRVEDTYKNGQIVGNMLQDGTYRYSDCSRSTFEDRKYIDGGQNLSVSFKAKTKNGRGLIEVLGDGGYADYGIPMEGVYYTKPVKIGDKVVEVNDVSWFKESLTNGVRYYVADRKGKYKNLYPVSVDEIRKTVTMNTTFKGEFSEGDSVLQHLHVKPVHFDKKEIKEDSWELYNENGYLNDFPYYNVKENGIALTLHNTSEGVMNIDDLKMGYATRTELYRDNQKIYDGYLSELADKEATDKESPNKVKKVEFKLDGGKVIAEVEGVQDVGTTYDYKVKAYPRSGGVAESKEKEITVTSGLEGYSYVVDKNPNTEPTGEVNSKDGKIEVPVKDSEKYYVHIQSVDKEGNKSGVSHFEFQDKTPPKVEVGVDVTEETDGEVVISIDATDRETAVSRIQLPSKEWHNGNTVSYTVKENGTYLFRVEDIAGNIAEENVKVSNIRKPGQGSQNGSGAVTNKAMLKIEGGELSLEVGEVRPIGVVKLESRIKKETEFTTPVTVRDLRGTGQGWRLTVRGGQLTEQVPKGMKEEGYEGYKVPVGSVILGGIQEVNISEGKRQDDVNYVKEPIVVDDGNTNLVMDSGEGNSSGEYEIVYGEGAIEILLDSTTVRVNKYSDKTEYASVIEWELVSAP